MIKKIGLLILCLLAFSCSLKAKYKADLLPSSIVIDDLDEVYTLMPQCYEMEEALIFYPGEFVEPDAYIPLAAELANMLQIAVFIQKIPFNMAKSAKDRTEKLIETYHYIDRWYMAGHSHGGILAASYIYEHSHEYFDGLILLASTIDESISLREHHLSVLFITGSDDGIINKEEFSKSHKNLPENTIFAEIPGANHSQFGSYGEQKGDNQALISEKEQQNRVVQLIQKFIHDINRQTVY